MDAARRWQVASVATAVAGLGLGSLLVGRSPGVDVAPIDLDATILAAPASSLEEELSRTPEIVPPVIREDLLTTDPGAPASAEEPASPGPAGDLTGRDVAPGGDLQRPDPADSPDGVDAPDEADETDETDDPDETDEADEADDPDENDETDEADEADDPDEADEADDPDEADEADEADDTDD